MKNARRFLPLAAVTAVVVLVAAACSDGGGPTVTPTGANGLTDPNALALLEARLASGLSQVSGVQQSGIWVDGTGSVTITPDVAVLSFGIETRADKVEPARTAAATAMDNVLKSVKANGVQERDIKTTGFSIQPITVYRERTNSSGMRETEPVIVGYRVTNSATAKVRDINKAGKVIDDAATAGGDAIRINGISFTVDDPKPLENQARELALKDALAKGRQVAQVLGVSLGTPTYVSAQGGSPIIQKLETAARGAIAADVPPTPLQPGETQVTVSVQVAFSIVK